MMFVNSVVLIAGRNSRTGGVCIILTTQKAVPIETSLQVVFP